MPYCTNCGDPNNGSVAVCPNPKCNADLILQRSRTKQFENGIVNPKSIEHGKLISDKIKRKALELVAILIAGIVVIIFGYSILGIGIILFAFVILLPDENDVIQQKPRGKDCPHCGNKNDEMAIKCFSCHNDIPADARVYTKMTLGSEHLGFLYARGFMKLLAASIIGWGTYYIHPILSIVVFFITYFSLPGSYEVTEPYRAIQAWARMFFGFVIAMLFLAIFSGGDFASGIPLIAIGIIIVFVLSAIATVTQKASVTYGVLGLVVIILIALGYFGSANPAMSLFFLTTAFYVVLPTRNIERDKSGNVTAPLEIDINFAGKWGGEVHEALNTADAHNFWNFAGKIMFIGFALMGALPVISSFLGGTGTVQIALGIVMGFAIIVGALSDRSARPYLGTIVMVFAILAFTYAQTGTVGNAVFGDYWPQVFAAMSVVANPITDIMEDTSCQTNELFYCAANPVLCEVHKKQNPCGKAQKKEGSDKALTAKMQLIQAASTIDPTQPLVGSFSLKNDGDFPIRNVRIVMEDLVAIDPVKISIKSGTSNAETKLSVVGNFTSCGGGVYYPKGRNGACRWELPFQKRETRVLNFRFESRDKTLGSELNTCVCLKGQTENIKIGEDTKIKVKPDTIKPIGTEGACRDVLENKDFPGTNEHCTVLTDDFGLEYRGVGYKMGGWLVRAKATYGFDYFVNASLPITLVSPIEREQLILDKKLTQAELKPDSKYSGGPVGIDMNIAQQPVGYGEETLVTVNIRNNFKEKEGKVSNGKLYIFIPTLGLEGVTYDFVRANNIKNNNRCSGVVSNSPLKAGNMQVDCNLEDLDSQQVGQVVFQVRYPEGVDIKRDFITANLDYSFENTITGAELPLDKVPAQ